MYDAKEFKQRRQALCDAMENNSVAVLSAQRECIRNGDAHFPYRQSSDFYYLTGFPEANAVAVFIKQDDQLRYHLFSESPDPEFERWNGRREGQQGALKNYDVDEAYPYTELAERLAKLLENRHTIYYPFGRDHDNDTVVLDLIEDIRHECRRGIGAPDKIINIEKIIHPMRMIKSNYEVAMMQKAVDATVAAHRRAMQACKPGLHEYQIEAELLHEFHYYGCRSEAYTSIVAGGENACILHYINNDEVLNSGDLLLIDAGAEYHNYAADVTRTFPINGKFSDDQKAIYELVLKAQLAAIDAVKPGTPWNQLQDIIVNIITAGLVDLGILNGNADELVARQAYRDFYMHNSGHWLGLDVHDAGHYGENNQPIKLRAGMVLTVEPGIYISADAEHVDPRWRGIGIRIEDDVLVTESGHCVLSAGLPKTVADIEALMANG